MSPRMFVPLYVFSLPKQISETCGLIYTILHTHIPLGGLHVHVPFGVYEISPTLPIISFNLPDFWTYLVYLIKFKMTDY